VIVQCSFDGVYRAASLFLHHIGCQTETEVKGLTISEILREPWPVSPNMVQSVGIGTGLVGDYLSCTEGLDILRIEPLGDLICGQQVVLR